MTLPWALLIGFAFAVGTVGCLSMAASYKWGRFTALGALRKGSAPWKAYLLALVPGLIFAFTFGIQNSLVSPQLTFVWMAAPALIGVWVRYHNTPE